MAARGRFDKSGAWVALRLAGQSGCSTRKCSRKTESSRDRRDQLAVFFDGTPVLDLD